MGRSGALPGTTVEGVGGLEVGLREGVKGGGLVVTLSMTFSRELGQSMAKQTKRRSVSG